MRKHQFFDARKLVDFWSVPHFLFGTILAMITITFDFPIGYMFFATLYLAIFWELIEMRWRLSEAPENGFIDIVLALIGFLVTFPLVDRVDVNFQSHNSLLIVTAILFLCLNFFAWRARFENDQEFQG